MTKAALDKAARQIVKLGKPKKPFGYAQDVPWRPRNQRYQLVDLPNGNGVELSHAGVARLVELLEAGEENDEELLEKLRRLWGELSRFRSRSFGN